MVPMTVFYADDDEDDLMLFEDAVANFARTNNRSINLSLVKNGEGLLEQLIEKADANAIVLLDLNMPIKSGFELLHEIRQNELINKATIIIYSTSNDEETISKSLSSGANFYFSKPNDYCGLEIIIDELFKTDWKTKQINDQQLIVNV